MTTWGSIAVVAVLLGYTWAIVWGAFHWGWKFSEAKNRLTREQGANFIKHTLEPAAFEVAKEIADLGFEVGTNTAAYRRFSVLQVCLGITNALRDEGTRLDLGNATAHLRDKFPELTVIVQDNSRFHIQPFEEWVIVYFDPSGKELTGLTERTSSVERAETKAQAGLKRFRSRARWEIRRPNGVVEKTSQQLQTVS